MAAGLSIINAHYLALREEAALLHSYYSGDVDSFNHSFPDSFSGPIYTYLSTLRADSHYRA